MTTIYVTKYALSSGVFSLDARIEDDGKFAVGPGGWNQMFHKNDFHLTEYSARCDFDRRKVDKIRSLETQLAKVRKAEFRVTQK